MVNTTSPLLEKVLGVAQADCYALGSDQGLPTLSRAARTESSVDDLCACPGVVLSRAATILRSIETQPSTGGSSGGRRYRRPPLSHKGKGGHAKNGRDVREDSFL